MITLTYGFGVGLAALAGVMAAPIYNVSPQMGSDLIIVVFAVVVIGGMGSIMGAIITGFVLGIVEGLTKVFFPEASNTVIFAIMIIVLLVRPGRAVRAAPHDGAVADPQASAAAPRDDAWSFVAAFAVMLVFFRDRAVRHLSGLSDGGVVLRAVRLRLQPPDRLCRPGVVRPRAVFRLGQLFRRLCRQVVGLAAGVRGADRHRGRRGARRDRRKRRHPPSGHLLRHDHAGAGADDVSRGAAREDDRRRRRHPGCAARPPVRSCSISATK